MVWTRRAEIEQRIRDGAPLQGLRLRGVRGEMERARQLTDEDRERVRAELGEEAAAGRLGRWVISTEQRASDGHVIFADAWTADLDEYRRSPIVLWMHNRWSPRIAESVVWTEGRALRAIAAFYPREVNPLSHMLGEMAARGGYRASVGFDIIEARVASKEVRETIPWALDITRAQLLEWSLVNFGADTDAIDEARAAGIDVTPAAEIAARMLDELGVGREDLERLWAAAADPGRPQVVAPPGEPERAAAEPEETPRPAVDVRAALAGACTGQLPAARDSQGTDARAAIAGALTLR